LRHDDIPELALRRTAARGPIDTVRSDSVQQSSASAYYLNSLQWTPWLRSNAGLRADGYRFRVASDEAANSGRASDSLLSPKLGLVFGPWSRAEYFVNFGYGFHSNDARGAVAGGTPLVRARGSEVGVRATPTRGVQTSLALWRLAMDSELVFLGDAGTTEASRPSLREGVEWTGELAPARHVRLDFAATVSRARFTDADPAGERIPGSPVRTFAGGAVYSAGSWSGSVRMRYFGPRPLTEDGSQRSGSSSLVNAKAIYALKRGMRLAVEVLNLFDRQVDDITYSYTSRLPGEPAAGVADRHFHPAEPRTLRLGLSLSL
jgi:outer membrane receptor for monomeric catechols